MKAIVYNEYGTPDVLKIQEIEKPVPQKNEVLIKVCATSVNYGDLIARNFKNTRAQEFNMPFLFYILARLSFGLNKPKIQILGNSFSGVIESVGDNVRRFNTGAPVFGYTGEKMGAYAEYLCMPEHGILAEKPLNMSHEEASTIPYGAVMAASLLKKIKIKKGHKVLIVGASGGIGIAAVQLARYHYGAEVTGVCGTQRVAFVKKLGADKVIDYEKDDFTKTGDTFDFIIDILGKGTFASYTALLKQKGTCLFASFKTKKLFQMIWTSLLGHKKVVCALANPQVDDFIFVKRMIEEGRYKTIVDKSFALKQTDEAHSYMETKMNKGNVVIKHKQ